MSGGWLIVASAVALVVLKFLLPFTRDYSWVLRPSVRPCVYCTKTHDCLWSLMQGHLYQIFSLEAAAVDSVGIFIVEVAISFSHMHPDKRGGLSPPHCPLIGLYWFPQRPPGVSTTAVETFHLFCDPPAFHACQGFLPFLPTRLWYRARNVGRNGHFVKCSQSLGLKILP